MDVILLLGAVLCLTEVLQDWRKARNKQSFAEKEVLYWRILQIGLWCAVLLQLVYFWFCEA